MRKPESNEGKEAHQETSLEGLGGDGTGSYAENGDGNGSSSVMAQAGNNVANEKGEEEEVDNDETEPHGWNGASDGQREELTDPSTGSRLVSVIQSRLDKAAAGDPEVRARECADMYEDVSGELSPRSLSRLVKEGVDVAAIKSAQATLLECPEGEPLYFYELLAQYLEHNFTEAKGLVSTCVSLWGNPHAASTYTLLLHRYILTTPVHSKEEGDAVQENLHKLAKVCVAGARRLAWHDLYRLSTRYKPLHRAMARLAADPAIVEGLPEEIRQELQAFAVDFLPFYDPRSMPSYLSRLRSLRLSSDVILEQLTQQVGSIRSEEPLAIYLDGVKALNGTYVLESAKLPTLLSFQRALYNLTSPGGPVYPPRRVRHAAQDALDHLFPRGRRLRRAVNLFFRLWRPKYVPGSLTHFFIAKGKQVSYFLGLRRPILSSDNEHTSSLTELAGRAQ